MGTLENDPKKYKKKWNVDVRENKKNRVISGSHGAEKELFVLQMCVCVCMCV